MRAPTSVFLVLAACVRQPLGDDADAGSDSTGGSETLEDDGGGPHCGNGVHDDALPCFEVVPTEILGWVIELGDFNGDALTDVYEYSGEETGVWLGIGAGRFAPPVAFPAPYQAQARAGDLDGDGRDDLVLVSESPGATDFEVVVYRGTTATPERFATYVIPTMDSFQWHVELGDFDGDQDLDLAIQAEHSLFSMTLERLENNGMGQLVPGVGQTFEQGFASRVAAVDDLDGDGAEDLLGAGAWVLYGGNDTFDGPYPTPVEKQWFVQLVVDLDDDGRRELVIVTDKRTVEFWTSAARGEFTLLEETTLSPPADVYPTLPAATAIDVNDNGRLEVVVAVYEGQTDGPMTLVSYVLDELGPSGIASMQRFVLDGPCVHDPDIYGLHGAALDEDTHDDLLLRAGLCSGGNRENVIALLARP